MNILYIYAHPNPSSFNGALKQHALNAFADMNINVQLSDLYEDKFKAMADWDDFTSNGTEFSSQYFLAQQHAYINHQLSSDIMAELDKILWADHVIFQFPLWWFSTPAILKGWLDRVLVKGAAYDTGKLFNDGLLKGKTASLVVSTQSPESAYQANGMHANSIDAFLLHIHHTLRFTGIKVLTPFVSYGAFNLDQEQQKHIITKYDAYLQNLIHSERIVK